MPKETPENRVTTLILGAAGRDFHNFNMLYRDDPATEVVAFTATQIPEISGRRYPAALAGPLYPLGIPVVEESALEAVCKTEGVGRVVFSYSDVTHEAVMHLASRALATGADYVLAGPRRTMLTSKRPVVAISAVRTGCGKSQTARWLSVWLRERGLRVAAIRHPMPYGDLAKQAVQRFASLADLDTAECTIEEREEYEPHIRAGNVIYSGVDYAAILQAAEQESDLILWDGGNNDFPFIRPDLHIVIVDALRPLQLTTHHPGEAVLRMADIVVVNKVDAAAATDVQALTERIREIVPEAAIVRAASPVTLEDPAVLAGQRVLIVEDGPTITHGGMPFGAGYVAASSVPDVRIIDPRPYAAAMIRQAYERYPHIGPVLPALGYGDAQISALRDTINKTDADVVVSATPIDLAALMEIDKPVVRARYEFADAGPPTLAALVQRFLEERFDTLAAG